MIPTTPSSHLRRDDVSWKAADVTTTGPGASPWSKRSVCTPVHAHVIQKLIPAPSGHPHDAHDPLTRGRRELGVGP